jgi:hypothetical protein
MTSDIVPIYLEKAYETIQDCLNIVLDTFKLKTNIIKSNLCVLYYTKMDLLKKYCISKFNVKTHIPEVSYNVIRNFADVIITALSLISQGKIIIAFISSKSILNEILDRHVKMICESTKKIALIYIIGSSKKHEHENVTIETKMKCKNTD